MMAAPHPRIADMDIVGVGFGPSNLALAVGLAEAGAEAPSAVFFERQPRFGWHRGMLIPGSTMQVAFLKDLVTLRNPASRWSFVAYLHAMGRLAQFINSKTLFPSRLEFHDYLEWAAAQFAAQVRYDSEVSRVEPVVTNGLVDALDVFVSSPGLAEPRLAARTRSLVVGTGLVPRLPEGLRASDRIWHNSQFMDRLDGLRGARRLLVVGAGQGAAEVAECLHRTLSETEVCVVHARRGFSVADDSPFTNAVFDPDAVDAFFRAPEAVKQSLLQYHSNTNYSVVNLELIERLHRTHYEESLIGRPRLRIMHTTRVRNLSEKSGGVQVDVEYLPTGECERLLVDAVVLATGYQPADPLPLLSSIAGECKRGGDGRLLVSRDYRIVTSSSVRCPIFLHGAVVEPTHGLAASLLSNVAVTAGEILRSANGNGNGA